MQTNEKFALLIISVLISSIFGAASSFVLLNPKINSLKISVQNSLNDNDDRLTTFENEINEANTNMAQLRESLNEVQDDINSLDEHVNQTLEEIKDDINVLNEEIYARLQVIESDLVSTQESVSNLQDDVASTQNQEWHRAIRVVEEPGSGEKSYVTDMFELSGGGARVRFYFSGLGPASEINIWVAFSNGTKHTHRGSSGYWGSYSTLITGTPKGEYYLIIDTENIARFNIYVWDYYDENEFTPTSTSSNGISPTPTNPYNTIVPYSLQTVTIDGDLDLDGEYSEAVWFVIETPTFDVDGYMQYNDEALIIGMNIPDVIRWGSQICLSFDLNLDELREATNDLAVLWHGDAHGGPYPGWISSFSAPIPEVISEFMYSSDGYQVEFYIPISYFNFNTIPIRVQYSPDNNINYIWEVPSGINVQGMSVYDSVATYGQITFG